MDVHHAARGFWRLCGPMLFASACFAIFAPDARAQSAPAAPATTNEGPFSFLGVAANSPTLLGDMWGLRPMLAKYGATLSIVDNDEVFGNVTGGIHGGFEYDGLTTATLQVDTQKAFGLQGGTFNASGLQIRGNNLSSSNLGTLQFATGIEANPATRLWELWYQQKFGDRFDIKVGQQSLDQEFMISQNAAYFLNSSFGWAILPTEDMPGGGPAYPLSSLGVRGRAHLSDNVTLLVGVYNGSPSPSNVGDPQKENPYGLSFPLNGGVLAIAELQFVYPAPNAPAKAGQAQPLPFTYKIGAWYDSETFADLRYDNTGIPLASPASDGTPASHRGDYAFYAVADQTLWRSEKETNRTINAFVRPMFTPLQDRNLIAFGLSAGVTMHEPFVGRDNDTAGVGVNFAQVSSSATGFNEDMAFYNPSVFTVVRRNETVLEATYQYQVAPWWQIQPDVQYVFNPSAGIVNPDNPSQRVKNELVLGIRTNVTF